MDSMMNNQQTNARRSLRAADRSKGFTLIELLVSITITLLTMVGVLSLFNMNSRLAAVQGNVADMQQSLRIAQYDITRIARMSGRGELPTRGAGLLNQLPNGLAVSVRNNVDDSAHISAGDTDTPEVLDGSDVLTVRGVFSSPIVQLASSGAFTLTGTSGTITVLGTGPTNIPQDLSEFIDAVNSSRPEAIMLVTPENEYGLAELDPDSSDVSDPAQIVLAFRIGGGTHTTEYATLNETGAFPASISNDDVVYIGLLEEYRYYIRENLDYKPGSGEEEISPKLSRARVYPGTEVAHADNDANWSLDVADNILDLQVALGLDLNNDGTVLQDDASPDTDEWLFNSPDDDPAEAAWNTALLPLSYLRITSLARTNRRDSARSPFDEIGVPSFGVIEDHDFTDDFDNDISLRQFRYRQLQTTVDLRNL